MYKVKQEDLIGDIEGFPIEIVQRMVECQVEQGNKADVSVFQNRKSCSGGSGGFEWCDTTERHDFWQKVILNRDFKIFFEKYPKENKEIYVENVVWLEDSHHVDVYQVENALFVRWIDSYKL